MVGRKEYFKREFLDIILYPFGFTVALWIAMYYGWLGEEAKEGLVAYLVIGTVVNLIIFYASYKYSMPKRKKRRKKKR